jgi:hypothetical protein
MGFAARIGTAFHRTLQFINASRPAADEPLDALAEQVRIRFAMELKTQVDEANGRPRERGLERDSRRADRAVEAAVVEAARTVGSPTTQPLPIRYQANIEERDPKEATTGWPSGSAVAEVEIPVISRDGLIHGRIDRAEHLNNGVRLVDHKSALRDDLPERYERQLQLYAWLWHETRAEWPVEAQVVYPLVPASHQVKILPDTCKQVLEDSKVLIDRVTRTKAARELATPGEVCQVCEFRPWCQPFWDYQNAVLPQSKAIELARTGLEGTVYSIELTDHYWKLIVTWHSSQVHLLAPEERFPQLTNARVGDTVRILDIRLRGQRHQPQVVVVQESEIFLIR